MMYTQHSVCTTTAIFFITDVPILSNTFDFLSSESSSVSSGHKAERKSNPCEQRAGVRTIVKLLRLSCQTQTFAKNGKMKRKHKTIPYKEVMNIPFLQNRRALLLTATQLTH